jgi:hypothetical protein
MGAQGASQASCRQNLISKGEDCVGKIAVMRKNRRLLVLHHELLYPALLGAALFEFTQNLEPLGSAFDILPDSWSRFLRLASALWFMLYFSVAFLALPEMAARKQQAWQFGRWSFAANLVEVFFILFVAFAIIETMRIGSVNYPAIFWGWLVIPVTGGIANCCSGRPIHWHLSCIAMFVGGTGLIWGYTFGWDIERNYTDILFVMYILLICYFLVVFGYTRCPIRRHAPGNCAPGARRAITAP